jgi:hypothetical protein
MHLHLMDPKLLGNISDNFSVLCEMRGLGKIVNSRGGMFSELFLRRTADFEPSYIEIILI